VYCDTTCHSATGYLKIRTVKEPSYNLILLSIARRELKENHCVVIMSKKRVHKLRTKQPDREWNYAQDKQKIPPSFQEFKQRIYKEF